jgi:transposase-like protein
MDTHKNARLTPKGREQMVRLVVDGGHSYAAAARKFNTTPKTVAKWVKRFRAEGVDGLRDRSSRPLSSDSQTPQATCDRVEALRRQRYTGAQIAAQVGVSPATVCRILRRRGLNKLSALEPAEPIRRYEREKPGELIHLDIKKLGRIGSIGHRIAGRQTGVVNRHIGIGWEFVHVCIDDASRVAFVQVMADQRQESAVAFLEAAVAYYAKLGVRIERAGHIGGGPKQLNDAINTALVDPGIKTQLANLGATASASTHGDFGKVIAEETEKWGNVIRAANIKVE